MYGVYAMAGSGRMQYDYKQTNIPLSTIFSHTLSPPIPALISLGIPHSEMQILIFVLSSFNFPILFDLYISNVSRSVSATTSGRRRV